MNTMPATVNGNTSLEFQISSALHAEDLSPEDKAVKALAVSELKTAIENYTRHLDPAVSLQRKELRELEKTIAKVVSLLENISPQTLSIYCKASDQINKIHSLSKNPIIKPLPCDDETDLHVAPSLGEIGIPIRKALEVAQKAITLAEGLENRTAGTARNVLAYEVARIMKEILNIKPAATRDNSISTDDTRCDAAYARLLRKVLLITGDEPPEDLYPLMERGLEILKNPLGNIVV